MSIIFYKLNLKKYLRLILILFCLNFLFFIFFTSYVSSAASGNTDLYGLEETKNVIEKENPNALMANENIPVSIGKVIGYGLSFIGLIFFILIIYGGFLWMTARGNEEQVKKAIDLITQACIGLAIVAIAYLITRFIGETLLSQVVTTQ